MSEQSVEIRDVCLLVGDEQVPQWFANAVSWLTADTDARIEDVVVARSPGGSGEATATDSSASVVSRLRSLPPIAAVERRLTTGAFHVDLLSRECVEQATIHRCTVEPEDGAGVRLPDEIVESVVSDADVAVQNGVGILQGDVLTAPENGVLSYHHGDLRQYRGPGYGFWEYLHGTPRGGVTLQRLTERLDAGEVVAFTPVDLHDADTYSGVRRRLDVASEPLLSTGVQHLEDPSFTPNQVPESELGDLYTGADVTPGVKARYLAKEVRGRARQRFRAFQAVVATVTATG